MSRFMLTNRCCGAVLCDTLSDHIVGSDWNHIVSYNIVCNIPSIGAWLWVTDTDKLLFHSLFVDRKCVASHIATQPRCQLRTQGLYKAWESTLWTHSILVPTHSQTSTHCSTYYEITVPFCIWSHRPHELQWIGTASQLCSRAEWIVSISASSASYSINHSFIDSSCCTQSIKSLVTFIIMEELRTSSSLHY